MRIAAYALCTCQHLGFADDIMVMNEAFGLQLENTVWGQLGQRHDEVDYKGLEEEFAAKQAVKQIGGKGPGAGAQQRPKQAMLLPLQRAQNVGVFLTRLKMGPAEVGAQLISALCFSGSQHGHGREYQEGTGALL